VTKQILIVDDHGLFREGVARLLDSEPGLEVSGQCASVDEALAFLASHRVDLVLLDIDLGAERGTRFVIESRRAGYRGLYLVVTAGVPEAEARELLRIGVSGLFLKHRSPELLADVIGTVLSGKQWVDETALPALSGENDAFRDASQRKPLTEREREVLKGIFGGLANKEIAQRIFVSESSVKATIQQLFEKTGVRTRAQLTRIALERYMDQL
jgi:DNA-binding NarL/FixJ family response regulator